MATGREKKTSARVIQYLFTLSSFPLRADWRKSDSSVDGEKWRWNSNSRDVVASTPSFCRPFEVISEELGLNIVSSRRRETL